MSKNATSKATSNASSSATSNATSSESKIRLTALFVLTLITTYLFTGIGLIPVFLTIDFALRGFDFRGFTLRGFALPAYSPLAYLAGQIAKSQLAAALNLSSKPVYMPPKRFSARIGFAFCITIAILHYFALPDIILSLTIATFAALESLVGFCAGCYVYNAWARLRHR